MDLAVQRIMVPLDFSATSTRALEYALTLARKFDAALHLVHVCEVPAVLTASQDAYAIAYTEWRQRLADEAEREFAALRPRLTDVKVSTEVLFGNPVRAIVAAAETNHADLIVMGTHGHGPVMHLVMGSVAERVVRTAECPVLTVRAPRKDEGGKGQRAGTVVATVLAMGLLSASGGAAAPATREPVMAQTSAGAKLYRTYCASCHGSAARGDGPVASSMRRQPSDLTGMARRNGGLFPAELVFRTIDGRTPIRGHGGPDMPVWGDVFARTRDGADPEHVQQLIQSLVDYLESIQARVGE